MPFGMPSGFGLLKDVCSMECDFNTSNPNFWQSVSSMNRGYQGSVHDEFRTQLQSSGFDSIDRFIQDNDKFDMYAKCCISHILLNREDQAARRATDALDENVHENAYRKLWNAFGQLGNGSSDLVSEIRKHRFVTFNYDRLLEHFLYTSLVSGQGLSSSESLKVVDGLDIVHVYGSLGKFAGNPINKYQLNVHGDRTPNNRAFAESVETLNLLTTHRASNENSERVTQHFRDTEQVVVLGFGFDATNCQYLRECYIHSLNGTSHESDPNRYMESRWRVCMFKKKGACLNRARNIFRVDPRRRPNSVGNYDDHDAAFLEHNVL